jgi:geranylgeranyl diphosphate/geranylgeranyl-bacteriochlorophyllide a reductase
VKIAVVGGGPAGSAFAYHAATNGDEVTLFDASHPREKPCGGGLTAKALSLLPAPPKDDPLPARWVDACRFESGEGDWVGVPLAQPVAIASRRELDAWLLRRATTAGAVHVARRVVAVDPAGVVRTGTGEESTFDVIVGADGAGSLVRRTFLSPTPAARRAMATGWFARGTSEMVVRFTPGRAGYLWLFPRRNHTGVGICAPLTAGPSRDLLARLESEIARSHPALVDDENGRYAHTIPSPSADPQSLAEIAGANWALLGDAAALADPITGEGIYYALRSARLLADTLRAEGSPARYAECALADFGSELLRSARLHARFYAPGFSRRMISYAARSPSIRDVLGDLVLGHQGYSGLKRRLVRAGPSFLLDSALALLRRPA